MMSKKLLAMATGAAFAIVATNSMASAGLTLTGIQLPSNVGVTCNQITLPSQYDIPKNGTLQPNPMSWMMVYTLFGFSTTGTCNFFLDDGKKEPVGTATLVLNIGNSSAQVVSYAPAAGYKVTMTPSNSVGGNFYSNIAGTLAVA